MGGIRPLARQREGPAAAPLADREEAEDELVDNARFPRLQAREDAVARVRRAVSLAVDSVQT
jgi:hypothetical protein